MKRPEGFWQEQTRALDTALFALDRVCDRWRARQGHDGSLAHQEAVQAAWVEAMTAAKAVSP